MVATPEAYFLTFTGYATWLHGDERGSVDRFHSGVDSPRLEPDKSRELYEREFAAKSAPALFDAGMRDILDREMRDVCRVRQWPLYALNVRTNHVHAVVAAHANVDEMLTALKANGTRALRENGLVGARERVWTRHGSTQWLWNEADIEAACAYVIDAQGAPLTAGAWKEWRDRFREGHPRQPRRDP